MEKEVKALAPKVTEKRIWNLRNLFISFIIGAILIFVFFALMVILNLALVNAIVTAAFFIVIYAIVLFFLLEPGILREVKQTEVMTVKEKVYTKGKPEYKQVPYETEKRIYVTGAKPKERLYKYVGSDLTKSYHTNACRLGRLIKKENKLQSDFESYFKKKKYDPCKVCILHKRSFPHKKSKTRKRLEQTREELKETKEVNKAMKNLLNRIEEKPKKPKKSKKK